MFDTFDGFDNRDINKSEDKWSGDFRKNATFKDTSISIVLEKIVNEKAVIHKGYFPETVKNLKNDVYAFVSLDTDLYKPIMAGLEYFCQGYQRVNLYLLMIMGMKVCRVLIVQLWIL